MSEPNIVPVDSVATFLAAIKKITWDPEKNYIECLFRGLPNSIWEVKSTARLRLEDSRHAVITYSVDTELEEEIRYNQTLITDYRHKSFRNDSESEIAQTQLGTLAQLRHHGAATSLIDFTSDPLVALWFACSEKEQLYQDGIVYTLGTKNSEDFVSIYSTKQLKQYLIKDVLNNSESRCFYWQPGHLNERILAQSSYFVIGSKNFHEEVMKNTMIIVNAQAKADILLELSDVHNINELNLFPDISGFADANKKDVPISNKELLIARVRFFNEGIVDNKLKLQDQNLQDSAKIMLELGKSFFGRAHTKLILEDEEGTHKDIKEGAAALSTAKGEVEKSLGSIVGKTINYGDLRDGTLPVVVDFIGENKKNEKRTRECLQKLHQLLDSSYNLKQFKEAIIIANTIIRLNPSAHRAHEKKISIYRELANIVEDTDKKVTYIETAIDYIDNIDSLYIKDVISVQKETGKGLLYSHIQEYIGPSDKRFENYIKKEIECYKKSLKDAPDDFWSMAMLGIAIMKELERTADSSQKPGKPELINGYMEANRIF